MHHRVKVQIFCFDRLMAIWLEVLMVACRHLNAAARASPRIRARHNDQQLEKRLFPRLALVTLNKRPFIPQQK